MPFGQLLLALATKWTGEEAVLPLLGEETETPANAHTDNVSKQITVFIDNSSYCVGSSAALRKN
jgi:hypothetical protein